MRAPPILALVVLFCVGHAQAVPAQRGSIAITMTGFRSDRGTAMVALWRNAKEFPAKPPEDAPSRSVPITNGRANARFEGVIAGDFAITVFHDEDGDGELKESMFGIPKEGIGFSRDVRPRFRAPRFEDAKLELAPGTTKRISIRMLYL